MLTAVEHEAERLYIAAILADYTEQKQYPVPQEAFTSPAFRELYGVLSEVGDAGVTEIAARLSPRTLEELGGVEGLADLVKLGVDFFAGSYQRQLLDLANRRRVKRWAENLIRAVDSPVADMAELVYSPPELYGRTEAMGTAELLQSFAEAESDLIVEPPITGLDALDQSIEGLRPALYIVAGRTGVGKSALLLQIAMQVSRHASVCVIDLEMGEREVARRVLAHLGLEKKGEWPDLPRIRWVFPGSSIDEVLAEAERAVSFGAKVIVLDYVQLVVAPGSTREQEVATVVRALQRLARSRGVAVVAGAQLRRLETNRPPSLADLRESGSLEQDASVVILLYHDNDHLICRIAKNRYGPTALVAADFYGEQMLFIQKDLTNFIDMVE